MNVARQSDGLLPAAQVFALMDLIENNAGEKPLATQLARDLRVGSSASIAKTQNTIEMLRKFEIVDIVDEAVWLRDGQGRTQSAWLRELGHLTAVTIAQRLMEQGPSGCLQHGLGDGGLWIDSMSLPGAHDGLSLWVVEFEAAFRESVSSRFWRISEPFEAIFLDVVRRSNVRHACRMMSAEQFAARRERDAANGLLAEDWVLAHERLRLENHPLLDQVRRISDANVSAGFDILSFSSPSALQHDLHIEVKSYVGLRRFFWSRNEIAIAEELGEQYSLYLVDRDLMGAAGYDPQVIRGPYSALIQTGLPGWTIIPETYECIAPVGLVV